MNLLNLVTMLPQNARIVAKQSKERLNIGAVMKGLSRGWKE
jgi:hypothetical protein